MRDRLFALGTGLVAVACCFGISVAAAAGATTLLSLAGLAVPFAAIIGIGAWAVWYRGRGPATDAPARTSRIGKDHPDG